MTTPTPKEPEVIQHLRADGGSYLNRHVKYEAHLISREVLAAYDALAAKLDAAVRERESLNAEYARSTEQMQTLLNEERTENGQLRAKLDAEVQRTNNMTNALGFFASCIKSGEAWSAECENIMRASFARTAATAQGE
jgi:hypothetical protein